MKLRHTWTSWYYNAVCQDCGWATRGKNGLGLAAQHHDRTGHTVSTDVKGIVQYLSEAEHLRRTKAEGRDLLKD